MEIRRLFCDHTREHVSDLLSITIIRNARSLRIKRIVIIALCNRVKRVYLRWHNVIEDESSFSWDSSEHYWYVCTYVRRKEDNIRILIDVVSR